MTSSLRRRTATAALATLSIGALLTATATATWAAPAPTSVSADSTSPTTTATTAPTTGGPTVVVQDGAVTVTLDSAKVQALCARVPAMQKHISGLIGRINGGSDVTGSSAALLARADKARAAGNGAAATRLTDRAALRSDRVAGLQKLSDRLTTAEQDVCVPLAAQLGTSS